ncbi:hypothetical protein DMH12_15430 [Streptomyces sp. WAC 04229]|uniref:hypothetical protein n=1 Tax=Streptomyces sp. WAC 04229 TaxID=2203206 RepID=UPI000F741A3E|nr:hypothetical protein [Streptomyces sp. WAC 04229]RSN55607.1 hypothetical protein DMH12_15430 [Streptomyces sp. WAC 04229]
MPDPKHDGEQTAARTKDTAPARPESVPAPVAEPPVTVDSGNQYEPYPGAAFFHGGRYSPIFTAAGARLTAEGHNPHGKRLGPDWTNAHAAAWASFQQELRPKGAGDVSGIPDEIAWDRLKVPRVTPLPKET